MRVTKTPISLQSAQRLSCSMTETYSNAFGCCIQYFSLQAGLSLICSQNSEDRFSRDVAQMILEKAELDAIRANGLI